MEWFCRALTSLITAGTLFLIALVFYPTLSMLMVTVAILSFMLLNRLSSRAKNISFQLSRIRSEMNDFLIQTIQSFKYLRITALIRPFKERLSRISTDNRSHYNRLAVVNALHMSVQEPLLVISLAGLSYYTVVISGNSFPSVMVAGLFFYRGMIELMHFNNNWQQLSSNAGSLEVIWSLEQDMRGSQARSVEGGYFSFERSIEVRNVYYSYDSFSVLRDINLSIPKYSSVAIVGVSGAGKTTLVDVITGLLKPTQGAVLIDGRDLRTLDQDRYRRSLGYVGQDTVVFNTTIENNISMHFDHPTDPEALSAIEEAAVRSFSDEFIRQLPLGYQTDIGERGVRLSGGQRQRLAIARELFRKPEILILDEATSSLDSQSEEYIRQSIEDLKGEMTFVIISHRLSTIINADMIYVLDQGRVVESGTFDALSRNEGTVFRQLCELQHVI
jgi:subfamily B ATP-binding cassette protein MsbA